MAVVRIPDQDRKIEDAQEITAFLADIGIRYERWVPSQPLSDTSTVEEILLAYAPEIEALKSDGGYITADVVDIKPDTPGLDVMLNKFSREHWHDEDEVRFTIEGHGLFHIHPENGPVVAIEVEPGDLMRVPRGTWHWFDLCGDKRIRAIRLFQDMAGWTPLYTGSGVDAGYLPVCLGLRFFPVASTTL